MVKLKSTYRLSKPEEIKLGDIMINNERTILAIIADDISVMQEFTMTMGIAAKANVIKPEDYYKFNDISDEEAIKIIRFKSSEFIANCECTDFNFKEYILNYDVSRKMFHRLLSAYKKYHCNNMSAISPEMNSWVDARDKLVLANIGLAFKQAFKMKGAIVGMETEDLITEGVDGLIKAASMYRPDLPTKFCTMATWWVRQKVLKFVNDHCQTVRVPSIISGNIRKYQRAVNKLTGKLGRVPEMSEVIEHTKMSDDKIKSAIGAMFSYRDHSEYECEQDLRDESVMSGHEVLEYRDARNTFNNMMSSLSGMHIDLITNIYGIGKEPITRVDYAAANDISMDIINTIEKEAIDILKGTRESGILRGYSRNILSVL